MEFPTAKGIPVFSKYREGWDYPVTDEQKTLIAYSHTKRIFISPPHMCGRELEFVKQAFENNYDKEVPHNSEFHNCAKI
jgi:hypothetical protein